MAETTYSRSYLKALSEIRKNQLLNTIINSFILDLQNAAASGETSYLFNLSEFQEKQGYESNKGQKCRMPFPVSLSNDELIAAFQKKFPDCKVFYDTYWIDAGSNPDLKNTLAINIDWS